MPGTLELASPETDALRQQLSALFEPMMQSLHSKAGAQFSVEILREKPVQDFISTHAQVLDAAFSQTAMSDRMRQQLQQSDYIFSGIKTFHELNEAFQYLVDENGNRKPFEQFYNDVRKINSTYNKNYLRAEYNFVQSSAEMAGKWEQIEQDGDRYNLQYRTAGDSKVRPEHAALNGVTLPPSDPFWQTYYPPNGWNCRCTVVQVRKAKYPTTPHDEAMKRGAEAMGKDTKGIFQFNAGIERKTFPDYNPYTIKRCRDCDIAKGKINLAFVPENELCEGCKLIRQCEKMNGYTLDEKYGKRLLISNSSDTSELKDNKRAAYAILESFPDIQMCIRTHIIEHKHKNPEYLINGLVADRKGVHSPKGISDGFKKAKVQKCESVVIDLDMHLGGKPLSVGQVSKYIDWRRADFENDIIKECYVVYGNRAIVINKTHSTKDLITAELEKLKQ